MIRSAWTYTVALTSLAIRGSDILLSNALGLGRARRVCEDHPRAWCREILRAAGVEVEIEGAEHLEEHRGEILVANHVSWFDVFALAGHLPVSVRFVAKKELEKVPIFGPAWKACGHVSIDRSDRAAAIASLEKAGELIHRNRTTVVMFAEGTRSPDGELKPFKKGPFVLAIQGGVPVVPAAIVGSRGVMPKGAWRIRPGRIRVRIGEPIPVEGLEHEDRDALTVRAHARVAALLEGVAPDRRPPQRDGGAATDRPAPGKGRAVESEGPPDDLTG